MNPDFKKDLNEQLEKLNKECRTQLLKKFPEKSTNELLTLVQAIESSEELAKLLEKISFK